ncbi:glycosyltransferase, partial [Planctomycetota bacterium]|nr:glycosyltransferase [Planctomycetota bacterium]
MSQACVIISAYNNAPSLKLALQGYLRQTSNNFRLIIADDGSRKDLLEAITPLIQQAAKMGLMWDHVWHEDQGFRKNIIL